MSTFSLRRGLIVTGLVLAGLMLGAPTVPPPVATAANPQMIKRPFQLIIRDGQGRPVVGTFEIEVVEAGFGEWAPDQRPLLKGTTNAQGRLKTDALLPMDPDVLERAARLARRQD